MRILISVEEVDPPSGEIVADGGEPVRFTGWLDLLRALSELLEKEPS